MARKTKAINDRLTWRKSFNKYKLLYLMLIPGVLWYVLFKYAPMFGIVIAFEKYQPLQRAERHVQQQVGGAILVPPVL